MGASIASMERRPRNETLEARLQREVTVVEEKQGNLKKYQSWLVSQQKKLQSLLSRIAQSLEALQ